MLALYFLLACTEPVHSHSVLQKAGYTSIRTGGYAFFACSEDDLTATRFEAKGPSGQPVTGAVCCGVFKNCTIRID